MATRYAEGTSVDPGQSKAEIERTLARFGADQFMSGWDSTRAVIAFRAHDRHVQFLLPLPDRNAREYRLTPTGRDRSEAQAFQAWEQAVREQWRALAAVIKAKLVAVESGIVTFEREFLAHILLPNGRTVGDEVEGPIAIAYETGRMPELLPKALGSGR